MTPPSGEKPPIVFLVVPPPARTNGFAIASFILALLGLLYTPNVVVWFIFAFGHTTPGPSLFFLLSLLPFSVLALIFGHLAQWQIKRNAPSMCGGGWALAGLIIGYGMAALLLLLVMVEFLQQ